MTHTDRVRLLLGLIKGAVIGAAIGAGAYALHLMNAFNWVTYGLVGACVGLLVGRPVWSHIRSRSGTVFTPILKTLVGTGVGVGIYALVSRVWGGMDLTFEGETRNIYNWQPLLGAAIGGIWGAFVEVDDAAPVEPEPESRRKPRS